LFQPAPKPISAALTRALKNTENHRYPSYPGKLAARAAVAAWYRRRFHVELDPETEVSMLLGSKEGVAHLIWGNLRQGYVAASSYCATCRRDSEKKPLPKPAYNLQTGTEGQFVVGFSLHQRPGDTDFATSAISWLCTRRLWAGA
jgi:hypothetical protein